MKQILLICDEYDWAFYRISQQIKKHLSNKYTIDIILFKDIPLTEFNAFTEKYDAILLFVWTAAKFFTNKSKLSLGIYDHYSYKFYSKLFNEIKDIHSFWVSSEKLYKEISLFRDEKIYICEDGVDTNIFKPKPFIVGWAGKAEWGRWYKDVNMKGVNLIKQAVEELENVELMIVDAEKETIPFEEMKEKFYDKIDCYICASKNEGTPNCILESLACGIPIITTDVGIIPQIKSPIHICDRTVEAIKEAILIFKKDRDDKRKEAVEWWDWKIKAQNFDNLIDDIIK